MNSDSSAISHASTPSTGGIPTWAKLLASLAGAVIVLGAVGGAFGISWARKLCLDSIDPVYIAGTLRLIGDFPDDAASGYHPVVAVRMPRVDALGSPGIVGVAFNEGAGKLQFDLAKYESPDSDPDPREEIDRWYDFPAIFAGITANFGSIDEKGKADVNGHEFAYQTGQLKEPKDLKDPKGATYKGMIGCLTVGRKVIIVEAASPAAKPLDINLIVDFLRKAHSF
jgi:hypothetical protein